VVRGKLDPLGDKCRETLHLGLGEMEVIADAGLFAGDADAEPAGAGAVT
jgi:hypothetical protein